MSYITSRLLNVAFDKELEALGANPADGHIEDIEIESVPFVCYYKGKSLTIRIPEDELSSSPLHFVSEWHLKKAAIKLLRLAGDDPTAQPVDPDPELEA